jgi:hypothetical protein
MGAAGSGRFQARPLPGTKIDGFAFTQFGGTVYWDKAGIVTATTQEDLSGVSLLAWEQRGRQSEIGFAVRPAGSDQARGQAAHT